MFSSSWHHRNLVFDSTHNPFSTVVIVSAGSHERKIQTSICLAGGRDSNQHLFASGWRAPPKSFLRWSLWHKLFRDVTIETTLLDCYFVQQPGLLKVSDGFLLGRLCFSVGSTCVRHTWQEERHQQHDCSPKSLWHSAGHWCCPERNGIRMGV